MCGVVITFRYTVQMLHVIVSAPSRGWQVKALRLELSKDPRAGERKNSKDGTKEGTEQNTYHGEIFNPTQRNMSPCDATQPHLSYCAI